MSAYRSDSESHPSVLGGLPFRVVAFLSLALLPIGLLAMWQTKSLDETLRARTELSLIALTELAASGERRIIQNTVGSSRAQAAILPSIVTDQDSCNLLFGDLVDASDVYSFIGFLPANGPITCSSENRSVNADDIDPRVIPLKSSPSRSFLAAQSSINPGQEVAVLLEPVRAQEQVIGQIATAIPIDVLQAERDLDLEREPLSLVVYSRDGNIISAQGEPLSEQSLGELRLKASGLSDFSAQRRVMAGTNQAGKPRVLTTVTLVPGLAYAVAAWAPSDGLFPGERSALPSGFLPALMWFASLFVAYFAVHRLVVGPIQELRMRMRQFALDRSLQANENADRLPVELMELNYSFTDMAYGLLDDEAQMEDALREKNVLLKEIHHRVKNNLQMISSIVNMQIRSTEEQAARVALKRLRNRILNLALVHRFLYQAKNFDRIDAEPLIKELANSGFQQIRSIAPKASTKLEVDAFTLVPDQAVPLALFVGELISVSQQVLDQTCSDVILAIKLKITSPGMAQLTVHHTIPSNPVFNRLDNDISTQLKKGFAMQLGGTIERSESNGVRTVSLQFAITQLVPDALDY